MRGAPSPDGEHTRPWVSGMRQRNLITARLQTLRISPLSRATKKSTRKMKNRIFAMPAAAKAMPPNPKTAAINAMMKKAIAHRSILRSSSSPRLERWNVQFCILLTPAALTPSIHSVVYFPGQASLTSWSLAASEIRCLAAIFCDFIASARGAASGQAGISWACVPKTPV